MPSYNALNFFESLLEDALAEKQCSFILEGKTLETSDVASARGLLPLFLRIMKNQHNASSAFLSEHEQKFLFGWLTAFELIPDPATLTGYRVECAEFPTGNGSRYTIPASILLAVDNVVECSPTPHEICFDIFRKEILYANNEIRPR